MSMSVLDLHLGNVGNRCAVRVGLKGDVVGGMNLAVGDLTALGELGLQVPDLLSGLAERITRLHLWLLRLILAAAGDEREQEQDRSESQGPGTAKESVMS